MTSVADTARSQGVLVALAVLLSPCGLDAAGQSPADQIRAMEDSLGAELVTRRSALAREQNRRDLHEWARAQYEIVVGLDPANAEARNALGYRIEEGRWVLDPNGGIPRGNRERPEAAFVRQRTEYLDGVAEIARFAASGHVEIARFATDNDLTSEARSHWIEALGYDPGNQSATSGLGFRRSRSAARDVMPLPGDSAAVELLETLRAGPGVSGQDPQAAGADGAWAPDSVRPNLRVFLGRHVGVQSAWMTEDWLRELTRWGDHTYVLAHRLLGEQPPSSVDAPNPANGGGGGTSTTGGERRYWFSYLNAEDYGLFTRWTYSGQPEDNYRYLLSYEWWRDDAAAIEVSRYTPTETPLDSIAHLTSQFVVTRRLWNGASPPAGRAGVMEGFAVLLEFQAVGANASWCLGRPATSNAGERQPYRAAASEAALTLSDPPVESVLRWNFETIHAGAAASKAASIWEWLLAHRGSEATVRFFRALASEDADPAAVIHEQLGWSPALFDEHWRRWAIAVNEASRERSD